ncbi:MAG: DNA repair exonuclease [Bacilli bacterium]|nr:DNA repair exonuclease [Bacilli bacterium]
MKVEFIHCGDLHLGCNSSRIDERWNDFFASFAALVTYAKEHQVSYILVSGDFFHLKVINSKTLQKTMEILQQAKQHDIKVFVIEGNHDKAFYVDEDSWLTFLNDQDLIYLLQTKIKDQEIVLSPYQDKNGSIYEDNNVRIIGLGYLGSVTERYLPSLLQNLPSKNKPTILMMHAAVNRLLGQDMGDVKRETLLTFRSKVDYIALGHIHNRYAYDDFIFNPGSLENIRIKDGASPELKGFYHVVIDQDSMEANHVQSTKRAVTIESLNASEYINPNDFVVNTLDRKFNFTSGSMVQLNIVGKVEFNPLLIDTKRIEEQLQNKYQLLLIEVNNYVNVVQSMGDAETEIDLGSLVEKEILDTLQFNFPDVENKEKWVSKMLWLADAILEKRESSELIEALSKGGEDQ